MLKRIEYYTMNSWNRETAPAYNMKVYNLGFKKDIESKIYDLMNLPGWYDEINSLIDDFNTSNGGYSAGFAGRSGGYLVLYQPKTNAGFEAKDTPANVLKNFRRLALDIRAQAKFQAEHGRSESVEVVHKEKFFKMD